MAYNFGAGLYTNCRDERLLVVISSMQISTFEALFAKMCSLLLLNDEEI